MRMNAQRKYFLYLNAMRVGFFSICSALADARVRFLCLFLLLTLVFVLCGARRIVVHFFMVPVLIVVGKNIKWRMDDDGTCMHRM